MSSTTPLQATAFLCVVSLAAAGSSAAEQVTSVALKDRTIAYVMVNKNIAVYQTANGSTECPQGLNDGPREQFDKLYPRDKSWTVKQTELEREGEIWHPSATADSLPFHEAQGTVGIGLNLDGKVGPNDFTSPEGDAGIDNQMYRAVGCVESYRGPDGSYRHFVESYMQKFDYNRTLIEISDVDDLRTDNDVTVTVYRGLDPLLVGSGGEFLAGGSQRVDLKWGQQFIKATHGRIVDGVLTSDPIDVLLPESLARGAPNQSVHAWRVKLKVGADGAEGLMAGYVDVERLYNNLAQNWATHFRAYGRESLPSEYRAFKRLADGYPDPQTGEMSAISTAWEVRWKQVYLMKPNPNGSGAPTPQVAASAGDVKGRR